MFQSLTYTCEKDAALPLRLLWEWGTWQERNDTVWSAQYTMGTGKGDSHLNPCGQRKYIELRMKDGRIAEGQRRRFQAGAWIKF